MFLPSLSDSSSKALRSTGSGQRYPGWVTRSGLFFAVLGVEGFWEGQWSSSLQLADGGFGPAEEGLAESPWLPYLLFKMTVEDFPILKGLANDRISSAAQLNVQRDRGLDGVA